GFYYDVRLVRQPVFFAANARSNRWTSAGRDQTVREGSIERMKILCIGAGSMGRRRLRDLTYLAPGEIILCEKSEERCRQIAASFGVRGFTSLDEGFGQAPDVVTVSTPPAPH